MNPDNHDEIDRSEKTDPYEQILFEGYTDAEIAEIKSLMEKWDKATYPTVANSILDHADRHGFTGDYLKYLRKANNFNKKGARKKLLLRCCVFIPIPSWVGMKTQPTFLRRSNDFCGKINAINK